MDGLLYIVVAFVFFGVAFIAMTYENKKQKAINKTKQQYASLLNSISSDYSKAVKENKSLRKLKHDMAEQLELAKNMNEYGTGDIIDVFIRKKQAEAGIKNIRFIHNHSLTEDIKGICRACNIEDTDMLTLLSNLLNNAFEACEYCDERITHIVCVSEQGKQSICITNSKALYSHPIENGFKTTKNDKANHGLGTQTVADIIEKYKGKKEVYDNGKELKLVICFQNKERK